MLKIVGLDDEDWRLLSETQRKLDEAAMLMGEIVETLEVLNDPDMMKAIRRGQADIEAGRVKKLRTLLAIEPRKATCN